MNHTALLQSLRQYDDLKKPALKELCAERGIKKPANSVTELRAQLRDDDDNKYSNTNEATNPVDNSTYVTETSALGTNAKAAIEKWNLHPPYDTSVTEEAWETYSTTRNNIKKESGTIQTEDGYLSDTDLQDSQSIIKNCRKKLLKLIAKNIPSLSNITATPETLHLTRFYVLDDGGSAPRTIEVSTRWYSPIGNGNFIDFSYEYHNRARWESTERFSVLEMRFGVASSDNIKPIPDRSVKGREDVFPVFKMHWSDMKNKEKRSPCTLRLLRALEGHMFRTKGEVPLLELHEMVLSAATVLAHDENNRWVRRVAERKFSPDKKESTEEDDDDGYEYDSNATDEGTLEEALKTQRRKRGRAEKDFFDIIMPIKSPEVTDEGLRHKAKIWLDQALPKVLSDSEDVEMDEDEDDDGDGEGGDGGTSDGWETE